MIGATGSQAPDGTTRATGPLGPIQISTYLIIGSLGMGTSFVTSAAQCNPGDVVISGRSVITITSPPSYTQSLTGSSNGLQWDTSVFGSGEYLVRSFAWCFDNP